MFLWFLFFPRLPLAAATFFSHFFTHNKVIIAPITAPNTRLAKNLPDGNILLPQLKRCHLVKNVAACVSEWLSQCLYPLRDAAQFRAPMATFSE